MQILHLPQPAKGQTETQFVVSEQLVIAGDDPVYETYRMSQNDISDINLSLLFFFFYLNAVSSRSTQLNTFWKSNWNSFNVRMRNSWFWRLPLERKSYYASAPVYWKDGGWTVVCARSFIVRSPLSVSSEHLEGSMKKVWKYHS
jgi:hypothetical protein